MATLSLSPWSGCTCGYHGKAVCMTYEIRLAMNSCALNKIKNFPRPAYIRPSKRRPDPDNPPIPVPKYKFDFPHKPYYPLPNLEKQQGNKVTTAIGFQCTDGIVLAADSEFTYSSNLKIEDSKFIKYEQPELSVLITGSAQNWNYLAMTAQKISQRIPQEASNNLQDVQDLIEAIIRDVYQNSISLLPPGAADFDMLIAARTPNGELGLLHADGPSITRVNGFECVGTGLALGKYLGDVLFDREITLQQGVFLASYILRLAKKYVPYVGGHSNIFVVKENGQIDRAFVEYVSALESLFAEFDALVRSVLIAIPDYTITERGLNGILDNFHHETLNLRKKFNDSHWIRFISD